MGDRTMVGFFVFFFFSWRLAAKDGVFQVILKR